MTSSTEGQRGTNPPGLSPAQSARRERIIGAAKRMLADQPYEQIQMRDVANSAGVALGTLYRYFSSKEHLYAVVITSWTAPDPEQLAPGGATAVERLRAKLHNVVSSYERRPHFYSALISLTSSNDPVVLDLIAEFSDWTNRWLSEDLAPLGDTRAQDLATMLGAINSSTLTMAIVHGDSFADGLRILDLFIDFIADEVLAAADG